MQTCLVVDDSSVIRKVARRILEGLDFEIVEAEDGEQALSKAAKPSGGDPARLEHAEHGRLRIPAVAAPDCPAATAPKVVFCTTENDVAHIARALHAGANEYIMKPFDKEIVEAKFQEVGLIARVLPSPSSSDSEACDERRRHRLCRRRSGAPPRHDRRRRSGGARPLRRWGRAEPDLEVVATLRNGRMRDLPSHRAGRCGARCRDAGSRRHPLPRFAAARESAISSSSWRPP